MLEWLGGSPTEGLTRKQETLLVRWHEDYLAHGLSTEPAERAAAETACTLAYEIAGMDGPEAFVWLDNPYAGCLGAAFLNMVGALQPLRIGAPAWHRVGDGIRKQVGDEVWEADDLKAWEEIGEGFWDPVEEQVSQVLDQVRNQVRDQAADDFGDAPASSLDEAWEQAWDGGGHEDIVRDRVHSLDDLRDQVRTDVKIRFGGRVRAQATRAGFGQHDAYWVGAFAFARRHLGLAEAIAGLDGLVRSCGWWWPFEKVAILSERPCFLARDDQGHLHHEAGAAIEYPDGWGVYAWHGVKVPKDVILRPDGITVGKIDGETNTEVRRVMVERMGHERFVRESGAKLISEDQDLYDRPRKLWHRDQGVEFEPLRLVEVVNSTPEPDGARKSYFLAIPQFDDRGDEILTPAHAVAWTFSMTPEDYRTLVET